MVWGFFTIFSPCPSYSTQDPRAPMATIGMVYRETWIADGIRWSLLFIRGTWLLSVKTTSAFLFGNVDKFTFPTGQCTMTLSRTCHLIFFERFRRKCSSVAPSITKQCPYNFAVDTIETKFWWSGIQWHIKRRTF